MTKPQLLQQILSPNGGRQKFLKSNIKTHRKQDSAASASTFLLPDDDDDDDDSSPIHHSLPSTEDQNQQRRPTKLVFDHSDQQRAMDPSEKLEFLMDFKREVVAELAQQKQQLRPGMARATASRGLDVGALDLPDMVDLEDDDDRLSVQSDLTLNLSINHADSYQYFDNDEEKAAFLVDDQSAVDLGEHVYTFEDEPLESESYISIIDKIQTQKIQWVEELERQDALRLQHELEYAQRKERRKERLAMQQKQHDLEDAPDTPKTIAQEESESEDDDEVTKNNVAAEKFHRLGKHIFFDM